MGAQLGEDRGADPHPRLGHFQNLHARVPPSSKIKKNWDAISREVEEEKPQGEQALNKLFQDIFARGSDEQKRAMEKSFVESGGTVLSTNWQDVGSRKVEGSAPKGTEVRKWSDI